VPSLDSLPFTQQSHYDERTAKVFGSIVENTSGESRAGGQTQRSIGQEVDSSDGSKLDCSPVDNTKRQTAGTHEQFAFAVYGDEHALCIVLISKNELLL